MTSKLKIIFKYTEHVFEPLCAYIEPNMVLLYLHIDMYMMYLLFSNQKSIRNQMSLSNVSIFHTLAIFPVD